MPNIQIKDVDEALYRELKRAARDENRSVSQQVLFYLRSCLSQRRRKRQGETASQALLSLAGSWEDSRSADELIRVIKQARRSSNKLWEGL